ncbi:hypothetical protein CHUAL_005274 [Chamberlinius hualienensis]
MAWYTVLMLAVVVASSTASGEIFRRRRDTLIDAISPLSPRFDIFDKGDKGDGGGGCMNGGGKGDKGDKGDISDFLGLGVGIPALILSVAVPLGLLLLAGFVLFLIGFIGRSNDDTVNALGIRIPGLPNLDLIRTVDEAITAYDALSKDEKCRQKIACQLGYIFKGSEKRARVLSILDSVLPEVIHKHFKPLKKAAETGENGKCDQLYQCDTNRFGSLFGKIGANNSSTIATTTRKNR